MEVRGKSVEVRGKSVGSPWKSVGSPWKSVGSPWKSVEPTFGFFGPNLGILVCFDLFLVVFGRFGCFFLCFWVFWVVLCRFGCSTVSRQLETPCKGKKMATAGYFDTCPHFGMCWVRMFCSEHGFVLTKG